MADPTDPAREVLQLPEMLRHAGIRSERRLDVRPVLERGGDPFSLIVRTQEALGEHEALHLVLGFEPIPLYEVMRARGLAAHTLREEGEYHVWFYRDGAAPAPARAELVRDLQPPVHLDVSGLEPPGPMMAILQRLVELGPGAQLIVAHHREPVLLYEKLAARGYAAKTTRRGEGDYLVHVAPAWVFEGPAR